MRPPYLTAAGSRLGRAAAAALLCLAAGLAGAPEAPAAFPADSGGAGGSGGSGGSGIVNVARGTGRGGSGLAGPPPGGSVGTGSGSTTSGGDARAKPGEVVISGAGDGHGVGMSQYGAEGYALHGATAAAILAHYYRGTALGHTDPNQPVQVLIGTRRVSFSGATHAGAVALQASSIYSAVASGLGLRIVAPSGRTVATASGPLTVTGPGPLSTGGHSYRGALRLTASPTGRVQTVNVVGLDDYVRGVVAEEMDSSWAPAALESQAIAARTYALTTTVDGNGYSLYDDTRSQMYGGAGAETATTDAAVAATSGQVVTYGGAPVATYFFASSGGETESIQNVWQGTGAEPWLVGVRDPYDDAAGNPDHHWTVTLSVSHATRELGPLLRGRLRHIIVTRRGVSPRVLLARVVGTRGTATVTGARLARAFGLPSTWMSFSVG